MIDCSTTHILRTRVPFSLPMFFFRYALLLLTSIASVFQVAAGLPHVVVFGQITNPTDHKIEFELPGDPIGRDMKKLTTVLHPDNHTFYYELEINEPVSARLIYDKQDTRLYLEPGDTLFVSFNGNHMFQSLLFTGKGASHNNYLLEIERAFDLWNDNIVQYQMSVRNPHDFRQFIDDLHRRKTDWFAQYQKQGGMTADFLRYAAVDLTYWRAYNLMLYPKIRSISQGVDEVIDDRISYYSFFNEVLVSNPAGLNNPTYLKFLNVYQEVALYWLKNGVPLPVRPSAEAVALTNVIFLKNTPQSDSANMVVSPGRMPYTGIQKNHKGTLYYQVISPFGRQAWVDAESVSLELPGINETPINKIMVEVEVTSQITAVFVVWPDLTLLNDPNGPSKRNLKQGERLEFLNQRTGEPLPFVRNGQELYDHFLYVKTADGTTGWVFNTGVVTQTEYHVERQQRPEIASESFTPLNNLDRIFTGQVLYYMVARDLYQQAPIYPLDVIKEKTDLFRSLNDYPAYNEFVEYTYQSVLRCYMQQEFVTVHAPIKYRTFDRSLSQSMLNEALINKKLYESRRQQRVPGNNQHSGVADAPIPVIISMVGSSAPMFKLPDEQGQIIDLMNYAGQTIVVDFWASWCQPCIAQMQNHRQLFASISDKPVKVIYISIDNDENRWKKYLREQNPPGIHVRDAWREVASGFGLEAIPTTFIVSPNGTITTHHTGTLTADELRVLIQLP